MGLGSAPRIAGRWTRLCAARGPRRAKPGESDQIIAAGAKAGAPQMHFPVAKTWEIKLQLGIVRCVLAPPERVCLEIMS